MELGEPSDAELLKSYSTGNLAAFDLLFSRHRTALYTWLRHTLGNVQDADDIFQEIWIRVIRHAHRYVDIGFKAWLWKIARSRVIDFRRARREMASLDADCSADESGELTLKDSLVAATPSPVQDAVDSETGELIARSLAVLTPNQKEVFLLRTQSGLQFNEIAALLEIPLGTALGLMRDATKKLKRVLQKEISE